MKTQTNNSKPWSVATALALSVILAQGQTSPGIQPKPKVVLPVSMTPVKQSPVKANEKLKKAATPLLAPKKNGPAPLARSTNPQPQLNSAAGAQPSKKGETGKKPASSPTKKTADQGAQKSTKQEAKKDSKPHPSAAQILHGAGLPAEIANNLGSRVDNADIESLKTAKAVMHAAGQLQIADASPALISKSLQEIVNRGLTDVSPGGAVDKLIGDAFVQNSVYLPKGATIPEWANKGLVVRSALAAAPNLQAVGIDPGTPAYNSTMNDILSKGLVGQGARNAVGEAIIRNALGSSDLPSSTAGREWDVAKGVINAAGILDFGGIERGSRTFDIIMNSVVNQGLGPKEAGKLAWDAVETVMDGIPNNSAGGIGVRGGQSGPAQQSGGTSPNQSSGKEPNKQNSSNDTDREYSPHATDGFIMEIPGHFGPGDSRADKEKASNGSTPASTTTGSPASGQTDTPPDGDDAGPAPLDFSDVDPTAGEVTDRERKDAWKPAPSSQEQPSTEPKDNDKPEEQPKSGENDQKDNQGDANKSHDDNSNDKPNEQQDDKNKDTNDQDTGNKSATSEDQVYDDGRQNSQRPSRADYRAWANSGARPPIGATHGAQPENPTGGGNDVDYTHGSGPIFDKKGHLLGGDRKDPVTKVKPPVSQLSGPTAKPGGAQPESPSGGGVDPGWQSGSTSGAPLPKDPKGAH